MVDSLYSVTTDKLDYAPGETVYITVTDVELGGTIEFQILEMYDDGSIATEGDTARRGQTRVSEILTMPAARIFR